MKTGLTAAAILWLGSTLLSAHRLDEYLQGAIVTVDRNRLEVELTLTPGVAIFPALFAEIDRDGDGTIARTEEQAYVSWVLGDLSLTLDGRRLTPRLLSYHFAAIGEMKEGLGEIQLEFDANLPPGDRDRRLIFENHHLSRMSVYQVNCLVPRDPNIRIVAQTRNYTQSHYELDFVQAGVRSNPTSLVAGAGKTMGTAALIVLSWLVLLRQRRSFKSSSRPQKHADQRS